RFSPGEVMASIVVSRMRCGGGPTSLRAERTTSSARLVTGVVACVDLCPADGVRQATRHGERRDRQYCCGASHPDHHRRSGRRSTFSQLVLRKVQGNSDTSEQEGLPGTLCTSPRPTSCCARGPGAPGPR